MQECHCFIRCAVTPEERTHAQVALEDAREDGDTRWMTIALAMLTGPCCKQAEERETSAYRGARQKD